MPVTYNFLLVIVSACIAIAAAFIALELANRLITADVAHRPYWLVGGAIAMGTGIWSMHFVAMLAFSIPSYLTYNLLIVLVSLVLAILAALQALLIVSRPQPSNRALLGGSASMGLGIATMHYSGMAAMEMSATIRYEPKLFALSVTIAFVVSLVALKLSILFREGKRTNRLWLKLVTACVMGAAVLAMHYTGMAAAAFIPQPEKVVALSGINNTWLTYLVCNFTVLVLIPMGATLYLSARH